MASGSYEQIVSHLEKELELNGLEAPDELQINTVTQHATQQNPEKPKPIFHHCKKPGDYRNQCCQLKREKEKAQNNKKGAGNNDNNKNGGQTHFNSNNKITDKANPNDTNDRNDRKSTPVYPPCET